MHFTNAISIPLITALCEASPTRHRYLSPRQLETLPPTAATNSSFAPPLSQSTVSKNLVPNEEDDAKYYLGYRAADFARPYAKYWDPNVQPISSEVQKGLSSSPWAKPLAFPPKEAGRLLMQPGYLQMENGWTVGGDGALMIAVRAAIPSSRLGAVFSQIDEYIGQDANKITIAFVDPKELGFDREEFEEQGVETVVVAQIIFGHTNSTIQSTGQYLVHQVRRTDDGSRELRSRFFLKITSAQIAHDLLVHCNVEMQHLNCFLPDLFSEFKDAL